MTIANTAFSRPLINTRERPLSNDPNLGWSEQDQTLREMLRTMYGYRSPILVDTSRIEPQGFIADGFRVVPSSGLVVSITRGYGLAFDNTDLPVNINSCAGTNDLSPTKPLVLSTAESVNLTGVPDATNPRWVLIEAKQDRQVTDPASRDVLNLGSGQFVPGSVFKTLGWDLSGLSTISGIGPINVKLGTAAGSPVKPTVDVGYQAVAYIYVPALATTITADLIVDQRRLLMQSGMIRCSGCFDVNHSTGAVSNAEVYGPPGVDVVEFIRFTGAVYIIGLQILGPFPSVHTLNRGGSFVINISSSSNGDPFIQSNTQSPNPAAAKLYSGFTPVASGVFPTGVLNGGNTNVLYNSIYCETQPLESITGTWSFPTHDYTVQWSAEIPVI